MEDIIIIGSGPIGLYSATLASLHGLKGFVIEGLDNVGGQLSALYPEKEIIDLPGFTSITAQEFINKLLKQEKNRTNALDIHLEEKFINFKKEKDYFLVTTDKNTYSCKTILLTTGMGAFTPRKLEIENIDHFGNIIYSIKSKKALADKEIIILGGGDSAVDWANTLAPIGKKVSIIHRRDEFRAKEEAVKEMKINRVSIFTPYQIENVIGKDNLATHLIIKNNEKELILPFDYLFVNYGLQTIPSKLELNTQNNAYLVNTLMMTNVENIFAIGNACTYLGKVKNITSGLGEAVTAITKIDQIIHPNKNIPVHF